MSENWIVTSLVPKIERQDGGRVLGADYQRLCLQSWREAGFGILSVNNPSEIEAIAGLYPEVTFTPSNRDARALTGRGNPFVADLLAAALSTSGKAVGIVNSDILFEPNAWWREALPATTSSQITILRRYDTSRLRNGAMQPLRWGFDSFFFGREAASAVLDPSLPFALGSPWWDFWLPAAFAFAGYDLRVLQRPICLHLKHKQTYSIQVWRFLGLQFAQWVVRAAEQRQAGPFWEPIVSSCRRIQASKGVESGLADGLLHEVSNLCMALTGSSDGAPSNATQFRKTSLAPPALAEPFEHIAERIRAGELFERAETCTNEHEKESLLKQGLALAQADTEALKSLTALLSRQARFQDVLNILNDAKQVVAEDADLRKIHTAALHEHEATTKTPWEINSSPAGPTTTNHRERPTQARKAQAGALLSALLEPLPATEVTRDASTPPTHPFLFAPAVSVATSREPRRPSFTIRVISRVILAKWIIKRVHQPEVIAVLLQIAEEVGRADAVARLTLKLHTTPR